MRKQVSEGGEGRELGSKDCFSGVDVEDPENTVNFLSFSSVILFSREPMTTLGRKATPNTYRVTDGDRAPSQSLRTRFVRPTSLEV